MIKTVMEDCLAMMHLSHEEVTLLDKISEYLKKEEKNDSTGIPPKEDQ